MSKSISLWIVAGVSILLLAACASSPPWGEMSRQEIAAWKAIGFTPQRAQAWNKEGFDPSSAAAWHNRGFDLEATLAWQEASFSVVEAQQWRRSGFGLEEAEENRGKGLVPISPEARTGDETTGDLSSPTANPGEAEKP